MLKIGGQKVSSRVLWLLTCDTSVIVVALLVAIVCRQFLDVGHFDGFDGLRTILRVTVVVTVCIVSLYYKDMYDPLVLIHRAKLIVRLIQALGIACAVIALIYYFFRPLGLGRGVAAIAAPIVGSLMLVARFVIQQTGGSLRRSERILVLGTGPTGIDLTREILAHPELDLKVVGFLDEKEKILVNPGIIGGVSDVRRIVETHRIDRIVLSLSERRGTMPVDDLLCLKLAGIRIEESHSCFERVIGRILVEHLQPSSLILSDGFHKSEFLVVTKRSIDIVVSLIALLLSWPVMLATAAAIWLETGTPLLFRQKRIGLNGQEFEILKFRSMRQDAEVAGPAWATKHDRRITRVGSFLRKYRLDELPQLVNVLRGEMSLVGPRPEQPHFCELLREKVPYFERRHSVRPGITGWAQVKYRYGATVKESKIKLELDLFYIKHLSVFLDLAILFETGKVMLMGRGAQ